MACPVQFIRSITSTSFMYTYAYTCIVRVLLPDCCPPPRHTQLIRIVTYIAKVIVHTARSYLHTSRNTRAPLKNDGNYRFIFSLKSWRQYPARSFYKVITHAAIKLSKVHQSCNFFIRIVFLSWDINLLRKKKKITNMRTHTYIHIHITYIYIPHVCIIFQFYSLLICGRKFLIYFVKMLF